MGGPVALPLLHAACAVPTSAAGAFVSREESLQPWGAGQSRGCHGGWVTVLLTLLAPSSQQVGTVAAAVEVREVPGRAAKSTP